MVWTRWQDVGLLLLVLLFFVAGIYLRNRRTANSPMMIALGLYRDIEHNRKLMEAFSMQKKGRLFKTRSWNRNRTRMDFLGSEVRSDINSSFKLAEEFNVHIQAANKSGSTSYLALVQVDNIRAPLIRAKLGLEQWIRENWGRRDLLPRRIGFFG